MEGWQIGLITQGQTGNPINILTNLNFTGNANIRPDQLAEVPVVGQPEQWFGTGLCDPRVANSCSSSALALPVAGGNHLGSLPRNAVTGPGFYNTDLSILKRTRIAGAMVEFRAEGRQSYYSLARPELIDLLRSAELLLAGTGDAVALCPVYGDPPPAPTTAVALEGP